MNLFFMYFYCYETAKIHNKDGGGAIGSSIKNESQEFSKTESPKNLVRNIRREDAKDRIHVDRATTDQSEKFDTQ